MGFSVTIFASIENSPHCSTFISCPTGAQDCQEQHRYSSVEEHDHYRRSKFLARSSELSLADNSVVLSPWREFDRSTTPEIYSNESLIKWSIWEVHYNKTPYIVHPPTMNTNMSSVALSSKYSRLCANSSSTDITQTIYCTDIPTISEQSFASIFISKLIFL